ncbi:type III pantothenate kinase [soil metagenome]
MVFIEIGNTSVKAVRKVSAYREFLFKISIHQTKKLNNELLALPENEKVILSSVRKDITDLVNNHWDRFSMFQITTGNLGKVKLDYKTPETLGIDRVLACLGATAHSPGQDVVVVDAGTSCTIDYMTKDLVFRGGVIMPGLAVYRKAMRELLPELPDVKSELPKSFPGRSTDEAIQWGMFGGFTYAVQSFVDTYRTLGNKSAFYATGGDGQSIAASLNDRYKCIYRENLVFDGMEVFLRLSDIRL